MSIYRQGDILIRKVGVINGHNPLRDVGKNYVIAEGEKTGHKHMLTSAGDIQVMDRPGGLVSFMLAMPGTLTHDEHKTIELEPGNYETTQEREVDYADRRIHDVAD